MKIFKGIFFCAVLGWNLVTGAESSSYDQACRDAVSLVHGLIEKLQSDTPFTAEEERRFFGDPVHMGDHNLIYCQMGYLSEYGKWLKSPPKYSPLGELLRLNRGLFLSGVDSRPSYVAGAGMRVNPIAGVKEKETGNNKISVMTPHYIYVFVIYQRAKGEFSFSNEKLLCFRYNAGTRSLFGDISVDGKSIMEDLGFYAETLKDMGLRKNVLERLQSHMESLEKQNEASER